MALAKTPQTLRLLTAQIVRRYLRHQRVASDELPNLIAVVHRALSGLGQPAAPAPIRTPAVPVRRSVQREYVVCLECGFRGQVLRRHLQVRHGLTPEDYRGRWQLPTNHPIVAPAYSERRATVAREIGLGRRRVAAPAPELAPTPKRRGRPRSAAKAQPAPTGAG